MIAKNYKKFIHTEKKIKECLAGIIVTSFFVVIAILVIRKFDINTNDELMYAYLAPMGVDCAKRIFIMIIAFGIIVGMSMFVVDKEYPIITKCGRNSLTIYLFHRVFSLIYAEVFPNELYQEYYILIALFFSIITVMILGTNRFSDFYAKFVDKICYALIEGNRDITIRKKMILLEGIVGIIIVFAFIWPIRLKL